jgi:peroxiredoxin
MRASSLISSLTVAGIALALVIGIVKNWPSEKGNTTETSQEPLPQTQSSMISQPRPDFSMPDLSGTQRNIKEWDGKVLAVNFWATWCEPCKQEITDFNILQKKYSKKGFQFIGVALDDMDSVQAYLKTNAITYPVLIGSDQAIQVASHYGDVEGVVPYTAFINRKGQIAFIQYGAMTQDLARQVIESLL